MPELVGSIGVVRVGAGLAGAEPGLAWQTPIGQILFLQSVDDEPGGARSPATPAVWQGGELDGAQRGLR